VGAGNRFGISARLTALLEAWSRIATIPLLLTWFVTQVQIMRTNMLINTKKTKFTGLNAPISLGTKKPGKCQTAHTTPRMIAESHGPNRF
jgi:hypothetical protein